MACQVPGWIPATRPEASTRAGPSKRLRASRQLPSPCRSNWYPSNWTGSPPWWLNRPISPAEAVAVGSSTRADTV